MEVALPAPPATAETVPSVYLVTPNSAGGNVGTLVRACAAFGAVELLLVGHPRHATHGAHGAQRHVKVACAFDWSEAAAYLQHKGCELVALVGPKGSPSYAAFVNASDKDDEAERRADASRIGEGVPAINAPDSSASSNNKAHVNGSSSSTTSSSANSIDSAPGRCSDCTSNTSSLSSINSRGAGSSSQDLSLAHAMFPAHERRFVGSTALVMALSPESAKNAARVCRRATFLAQFQPVVSSACVPVANLAAANVTSPAATAAPVAPNIASGATHTAGSTDTAPSATASNTNPLTGDSGREWPPVALDLSTVACGVLHHFASWAQFSTRSADKYKFDIERSEEHRRSRKGHAERVSYPGMAMQELQDQSQAISNASPLSNNDNIDDGDESCEVFGGLFEEEE